MRMLEQLTSGLVADLQRFHANNTDFWRFPAGPSQQLKHRVTEWVLGISSRAGFVRVRNGNGELTSRLQSVLGQIDELDKFHEALHDEPSRRLLLDLLRFRILGSRYVRLPLNNRAFWETRARLERDLLVRARTANCGGWDLNEYRLDDAHGGIDLQTTPLGLLCTFFLEQYAYRKVDPPIRADKGETVVDAGGCFGDTALYFAHRVGTSGSVYCFEFAAGNLEILRQNLALNPALAARIRIVEQPAWSSSGEHLRFQVSGPTTRLGPEADLPSETFETLSIDDLVAREGIKRVGLIKMDIEGAELAALQGAERTIRSHRPKLAVAVYHNEDDFTRIPAYLQGLGLGYEFFLDHFTIFGEETVLFARRA